MCWFKKKKTISYLKKEVYYYKVIRSFGLFGKFSSKFLDDTINFENRGVLVLARNSKEAVLRAQKRGYGLNSCNLTSTSKNWARWAVKRDDKPNNHRYIMYYD